jgi:leader peptidase (prepilin peptidase) / N-methyltransferase
MEWLIPLYAGIFGAIIGSFLNVVIHRYPIEESIVFPPSRCPNCRTQIKPWDNVPVISYILLLGRCRSCKVSISPRYPLIELANALFYAALAIQMGLTWALPLVAAIVSMTIVLIFIDLDIQMLPDVIDLPGIGVGIAIGALRAGETHPHLILSDSLLTSLLGAFFGWSILFALAFAYKAVRGVHGMGEGDMKMLAMIGAVVGWAPLLPILFVASITGVIFVGILAIGRSVGSSDAIPFGVFLGLATLLVIFFGRTLFAWYALAVV